MVLLEIAAFVISDLPYFYYSFNHVIYFPDITHLQLSHPSDALFVIRTTPKRGFLARLSVIRYSKLFI